MRSEILVKEMLEMIQQVETSDLPMFFGCFKAKIRENSSFSAKSRERALDFVTALEAVVMEQRKKAIS